jgi:hypothetical protein
MNTLYFILAINAIYLFSAGIVVFKKYIVIGISLALSNNKIIFRKWNLKNKYYCKEGEN